MSWGRTITLDPHVHTAASHDASGSIEAVLQSAAAADLDAVAITDHDTTVAAREALAIGARFDVTVVPGVEISTADGHLLALGVREAPSIGRPLEETVRWVRGRDGVAVVPHPFQRSRHGVRKGDIGPCDGIEVFNAWAMTGLQNSRAETFATRRGYPKLGGSDAHEPSMIGQAATEVGLEPEDDDADVTAILEGIRAGRTRAVGDTTSKTAVLGKYTRSVRHRVSPAEP